MAVANAVLPAPDAPVNKKQREPRGVSPCNVLHIAVTTHWIGFEKPGINAPTRRIQEAASTRGVWGGRGRSNRTCVVGATRTGDGNENGIDDDVCMDDECVDGECVDGECVDDECVDDEGFVDRTRTR